MGKVTQVSAPQYVKEKIEQIAAEASLIYNKARKRERRAVPAAIARRSFVLGFFVANTLRDAGIRVNLEVDKHEGELPTK